MDYKYYDYTIDEYDGLQNLYKLYVVTRGGYKFNCYEAYGQYSVMSRKEAELLAVKLLNDGYNVRVVLRESSKCSIALGRDPREYVYHCTDDNEYYTLCFKHSDRRAVRWHDNIARRMGRPDRLLKAGNTNE